MFGIETLSGNVQAVVLVGIVLVEAFVLYVGYGGLETLLGPTVKRVLEGRCPVRDALFGRCPAAENGGAKQ
jgi:hypothetical protein